MLPLWRSYFQFSSCAQQNRQLHLNLFLSGNLYLQHKWKLNIIIIINISSSISGTCNNISSAITWISHLLLFVYVSTHRRYHIVWPMIHFAFETQAQFVVSSLRQTTLSLFFCSSHLVFHCNNIIANSTWFVIVVHICCIKLKHRLAYDDVFAIWVLSFHCTQCARKAIQGRCHALNEPKARLMQ